MNEKLKILVVEDDEILLNLYKIELSSYCEVLTANSAADGIKNYKNHPVPIVITDICMESEMAGIEMINEILKLNSAVQIIIISTLHDKQFVALQTAKGIVSLPKPIDFFHLRLAIYTAKQRFDQAKWIEKFKVLLSDAPWLFK